MKGRLFFLFIVLLTPAFCRATRHNSMPETGAPLTAADPETSGIHFLGPYAEQLENMVSRLEKASPAIQKTLLAFRGSNGPGLFIGTADGVRDVSGLPADGITVAHFKPAMRVDVNTGHMTDVINPDLTGLVKVVITINDAIVSENRRFAGVLIHEIGHADDAITNPGRVAQDGYNYSVLKFPYKPMAERPEEIRNIAYIDRVLREIREFDKSQHRRNRLHPTRELP